MEKCKNTTENKSSQISHPALLVGHYATAVKDYPLTEDVRLPITGKKVLVVGCRIKTELSDFPFEVMLEVLDSKFLSGDQDYLTIGAELVPEYLTDIHA